MSDEFSRIHIRNEKQLKKYVEYCNNEIEFDNYLKPVDQRDPLLDFEKVREGFRKMNFKEYMYRFREKHECIKCLRYQWPRTCFETRKCPFDDGAKTKEKLVVKQPTCPKDLKGNCPYGNEVGTCFGHCYQNKHKSYGGNTIEESEGNSNEKKAKEEHRNGAN